MSAAPAKEETSERVSYTDQSKSQDGEWTELASPTRASHGREYISVDARFGTLRIDATSGRPILKSVRIVYSDGKQHKVRVGKKLGRDSAVIALRGAQIDHVVVDTEGRGSYTVHGARLQGVAAR